MAPQRALKTDEEIAGVPLGQPILIELPGSAIEEDEGNGGIVSEKPAGKVRTEEPLDGAKVLQEQLEAAQRATDAANARADKEARDGAEARRLAAEAEKRSTALEGDVITGGLAAAQREVAAAESELERAGEAGDFKAMAKAQSRIGRASAQVLHYEAGAAEIAERPKSEARQEQVLQQPRSWEDNVRSNAGLLRSEQDWMIKNKSSFDDPDFGKKLDFAYAGAQKANVVRGSQAYFDYIERATGLVADDRGNDRDNNQGGGFVSAPVSRQERGGDGRPQPNRITLSPEQRELAKSIGVSEIEYAKQVQNFETAKKADPEKYSNR